MSFARRYIAFRRRAVNRHGVHSPFVYDLINHVLRRKEFENARALKSLREEMLASKAIVNVLDRGAGSRVHKSAVRKVGSIAKSSSTPLVRAGMLQRLIDYMGYTTVLEMGTNLGLTTCVLASAKSKPNVVTLEGCPELAAMAVKNLEKLNLNARVIVGDFKERLDLALAAIEKWDMAYIDGNHRKEPTLAYFDKIQEAMHNDSVVVVGDIHWSDEMQEAWEEIKNRAGVRVTIDLFDMGLVFFRKEMTKENFILRY